MAFNIFDNIAHNNHDEAEKIIKEHNLLSE